MMNILVVNDDGIEAEGIKILQEVMKKYGNVYVSAPLEQQSAKSHSITILNSFKAQKISDTVYGVGGTPADCVKFAIHKFDVEFDLVVSGINDGPNLGGDVFYSGTVAGATEGALYNIPGIALSVGGRRDFTLAKKELENTLDFVILNKLYSNNIVLNINFPNPKFSESKGFKVCKQGKKEYRTTFVEADGLFHNKYEIIQSENDETTDMYAHENGYIGITPLLINRTNIDYIDTLKEKVNQ
ncbi:5'/3'-nucleotidase SurE [Mycoplasmatota bacterium WC44]